MIYFWRIKRGVKNTIYNKKWRCEDDSGHKSDSQELDNPEHVFPSKGHMISHEQDIFKLKKKIIDS